MHPHDIGDVNVERLVGASYQPELPDPAFVTSLTAKMQAAANLLAVNAPTADTARLCKVRHRLGWAMAAAACAAGVALALHAVGGGHYSKPESSRSPQATVARPDARNTAPKGAEMFAGLTAMPRPSVLPENGVAIGTDLVTEPGESRRVRLADGSVVYLNGDTQVKYVADRRIQLTRGQVYVEVAPRVAGSEGATFVVKAPDRDVEALGTHFSVWTTGLQSGVAVTQGKVQIKGLDSLVYAGQQLLPGEALPAPGQRDSHVLEWTRPLMIGAESPLVPASQFAGGALVAVDPNGQETRLSMRKFHVDVHIEDGFARTTIDQTYFNETMGRLEGTFYFPLPADAALSRLAMYVKQGDVCKLMEGGMAERDLARNVFETIMNTRRDPALLEWVDGSTFKMRVFPLEPREEKRIILSYTQKLPGLYGTTRYRFPAGHSLSVAAEWSLAARVKDGAKLRCFSESHPAMRIKPDGPDMLLTMREQNATLKKDVVLVVGDKEASLQEATEDVARFRSFVQDGNEYVMLRYRPKLTAEPKRERRDWVFLYEASANRDPLLARAQIDIIRALLVNAEHNDTFTVVAANTRVHIFDNKLRPATGENIDAAVRFLEGVQLIGALDLGQALTAVQPMLGSAVNPYFVHVGSGIATLGQRSDTALAAMVLAKTQYVGIGVGKQWGRAFMKSAAERTGGYVTQINPDEPINWRAFDLLATLNTPRMVDVRVIDKDPQSEVAFLSDSTVVAQGEEVCAVALIDRAKKMALPEAVQVVGKLAGKEFVTELKLEKVKPGAGYLPRQWAKLELDRLLAEGAVKNKNRIIELSKESYVMTPFTSLLVLETEEDYVKYNVDRGRKDHWAMYPCPETIAVVRGPVIAAGEVKAEKVDSDKVLGTVLVRVPPEAMRVGDDAKRSGSPAVPAIESDAITMVNRIGPLKFTDASDLARIISDVYSAHTNRGPPDISLSVGVDQRTNSLVVHCSLALANEIKTLAKDLENSVKDAMPSIQVLRAANIDPEAMLYARNGLKGRQGAAANLVWGGLPGLPSGFGGYVPFGFAPPGFGSSKQVIGTGALVFGSSSTSSSGVTSTCSTVISTLPAIRFTAIGDRQVMAYAPPANQIDIDRYVASGSSGDGGFFARTQLGSFQGQGQFNDAPNYRDPSIRTIAFPFTKAPWDRVLEWLTEITQLPLITTYKPTGTLTLNVPKGLDGKYLKFTVAEIIDILNENLLEQKYVIIRRQLSYMIWPSDEPLPFELVKSVTPEEQFSGDLATWEFVRVSVRPKARKVEPVAPVLKKCMGPFGQVIPLEEPNQLIMIDTVAGLRIAVTLLREIDTDDTQPWTWSHRCINCRAAVAVEKLQGALVGTESVFAAKSITCDERTNTITVVGPKGVVAVALAVLRQLKEISATPDRAIGPRLAFFERPTFAADNRIFDDLASYAPGLQTSPADIEAAVEAETAGAPPGHVNPDCRLMIDKARAIGWQRVTFVAGGRQPAFTVTFNGAGQFAWDRVLASGLREQVICDGKTLWHLYPEIGLGAKRTMSRFHWMELQAMLPWLVQSADDLAKNADVEFVDKGVVGLVPRGAQQARDELGKPLPYLQVNLVFGDDGRLVERGLFQVFRHYWLSAEDRSRLVGFIEQLASNVYKERERARVGIEDIGVPALPVLREALKGKPELEAKLRLEQCIQTIERNAPNDGANLPDSALEYRQFYGADGTVLQQNVKAGPALDMVKLKVSPAQAPVLKADFKGLVVLPTPLRTRLHLEAKLKGDITTYDDDTAVGLLASACATGDGAFAKQLVEKRFQARDDRRIGLDVLLTSAGVWREALKDQPNTPLADYLAGHLEPRKLDQPAEPKNGFIPRLARFRALWKDWQSEAAKKGSEAELRKLRERTAEFLGHAPLPVYDWALLSQLCRNGDNTDAKTHRAIMEASKLFAAYPDLDYAARYEVGLYCCNSKFGADAEARQAEGRKVVSLLYLETLDAGMLPPLDTAFRSALLGTSGKAPDYAELLRQAAGQLALRGRRLELLALPGQVAQLGDKDLANELMGQGLAAFQIGGERDFARRAALEFYLASNQPALADSVLQQMLADEPCKSEAALWQLAAVLAELRELPARAVQCREQQLELEFRHLPPVIDLRTVRGDYGKLLTQYQQIADAYALLQKDAPKEFLGKVVLAADRWRSLDPEPTQVCQQTAKILQKAGALELAWGYLTTPIGMKPNEAAPWLDVVKSLQGANTVELADRAFAQAFAAEPTNAQILWDRAQMLGQAGREGQAREIYGVLAAGQWQPRFQWMQEEAKRKVMPDTSPKR